MSGVCPPPMRPPPPSPRVHPCLISHPRTRYCRTPPPPPVHPCPSLITSHTRPPLHSNAPHSLVHLPLPLVSTFLDLSTLHLSVTTHCPRPTPLFHPHNPHSERGWEDGRGRAISTPPTLTPPHLPFARPSFTLPSSYPHAQPPLAVPHAPQPLPLAHPAVGLPFLWSLLIGPTDQQIDHVRGECLREIDTYVWHLRSLRDYVTDCPPPHTISASLIDVRYIGCRRRSGRGCPPTPPSEADTTAASTRSSPRASAGPAECSSAPRTTAPTASTSSSSPLTTSVSTDSTSTWPPPSTAVGPLITPRVLSPTAGVGSTLLLWQRTRTGRPPPLRPAVAEWAVEGGRWSTFRASV